MLLIKIQQGNINPNTIELITNVKKFDTIKVEFYFNIKTTSTKEYIQIFPTQDLATKHLNHILNQITTGMSYEYKE